jgi:hypothetical protein
LIVGESLERGSGEPRFFYWRRTGLRGLHAFCVRFTRLRRASLRDSAQNALAWFMVKNLDCT